MTVVGALVFGVVVGYLTYRTLVRTTENAAITDLTAVIGAIGGGAVTKLYEPSGEPFAWYAIGLALGMAAFFFVFWRMNGKAELSRVMAAEADAASGGHGSPQA